MSRLTFSLEANIAARAFLSFLGLNPLGASEWNIVAHGDPTALSVGFSIVYDSVLMTA